MDNKIPPTDQNKKPFRKRNRIKDYNYSLNGAYFITICTKDRKRILGDIVGDALLGVPALQLTETGEIVRRHIENINAFSEYATIDHYVIMPNHIHMIISIDGGTTQAASPTKDLVPSIVRVMKSQVSKETGKSIWQRSYFDHVIRNETGYQIIWEYIETNPLRWREDKYYMKQ